jgi:hypothetical protein
MSAGTTLSCLHDIRSIDDPADMGQVKNIRFKGGSVDWGHIASTFPAVTSVTCMDRIIDCVGTRGNHISSDCECKIVISDVTPINLATPDVPSTDLTTLSVTSADLTDMGVTSTDLTDLGVTSTDLTTQVVTSFNPLPLGEANTVANGTCNFKDANDLDEVWQRMESFACYCYFVGGVGVGLGLIFLAILCGTCILYALSHSCWLTIRILHRVSTFFIISYLRTT